MTTLTGVGTIDGRPDLTELPLGSFRWVDAAGNEIDPIEQASIAGVHVSLRDSAGIEVASTRTDANGDYAFEGLPLGEYTVFFTVPADVSSNAGHDELTEADEPPFVRPPIQTWTPDTGIENDGLANGRLTGSLG